MCQQRRHVKLGFCEEPFPEGTHICYLFSDPAERRQITAQYLHSAWEESEQADFFHDGLPVAELDAALRELGVPEQVLRTAQQLRIKPAMPTYCPDGRFEPERMWGLLEQCYEDARRDGFSGGRATGEMTWALSGVPGSERLVEYEAGINEVVARVPLTVLCQYDATRFDGATLQRVLEVHPMLLVQGQIVRNPYYRVPSPLPGSPS